MVFTKEFKYWTMADDDRYNIDYIESKGTTLEELLDNAVIYITDWYGNQARETWTLYDLHQGDYIEVEVLFVEALVTKLEVI